MQKTLGLVTIIGERQSEAIKNFTVNILSTICVIIDKSNKLNENLSVISLELILSFLVCLSLDIETNSFTCFKFHIPISSLKLKQTVSFLTLLPLCVFAKGIYFPCCYIILWLRYLPISLMLIKGFKEYK